MRQHWVNLSGRVEDELPVYAQNDFSVDPKKFDAYALESTFRQGWHDLAEMAEPRKWLYAHTFVILKPDCFVGRKHEIVFDFLSANSFDPVCLLPFRNTRSTVSELWRYQWNSVPVDRSLVSTRINTIQDSALLVLNSPSYTPASVRLTSLKGNSQKFLRKPNTLRWAMDCTNPMLGYVHSPDEPLDVLRELSIIVPSEERRTIFESNRLLDWNEVRRASDGMLQRVEAHDLDYAFSRLKLLQASNQEEALAAYIDSCFETLGMSWRTLLRLSGMANDSESNWDALVVAAHCIFQNYDIPGIFENPGIDSWKVHLGKMR